MSWYDSNKIYLPGPNHSFLYATQEVVPVMTNTVLCGRFQASRRPMAAEPADRAGEEVYRRFL
ncbi:hypothetical protein TRIP_B250073 [uncultured Desulfatiglans sp.]|uniref:Uncharacterized protein n=1 Tax=Uncultured Desulfatiglans sp. TaxID=1748965 RepID=A0A653A4G5_UNCDX|nr:hypothetical protein TRIP_B250073 [uncultured Desulfatiglans sp.]